jgi:hypothetical protein
MSTDEFIGFTRESRAFNDLVISHFHLWLD